MKSNVAITTIAATIPTSCALGPNDAGTAVRLALDEMGKPCEKPAHRLMTPSAAEQVTGPGEEVVGIENSGELRVLARQQGETDARDVSDEHRLRQHVGDEPESGDRRKQADRPHDQCEGRHQRHIPLWVAGRNRADARRGENRCPWFRTDTEVSRRPDERVRDQGEECSVEPRHRRLVGEFCICHPLWRSTGSQLRW
jgi:hypothetical protein